MTTRKSPATSTQVQETPASEQRSTNGSVNRVTLVGRLVADPTARSTSSGIAVTTVRVATNERGSAEFHDVVLWRQLAEFATTYLGKGRLVYIEGRLQTRSWQAANPLMAGCRWVDSHGDGDHCRPLPGADPSGAGCTGCVTVHRPGGRQALRAGPGWAFIVAEVRCPPSTHPCTEIPMASVTFLWVVNRTEECDGLYLFEEHEDAAAFAALYDDAYVVEESIFTPSSAAELIAIAGAEQRDA